MTHDTTGKHAATPAQRRLLLTQPDTARRGRYTGRRIAGTPAAATRRPRLTHLVPLGALLVATTGVTVAAIALPDGSDGPSTSTATGKRQEPAGGATTPSGPQVVSRGTVVTPAAFPTTAGGKHRADPDVGAPTPVSAGSGTAARHRADPGDQRPGATSTPTAQPTVQPSTQPSTQPTAQPTAQPTGAASGAPSGAPSDEASAHPTGRPSDLPTPAHSPSTGKPSPTPSGDLLGDLLGTVGDLLGQ